MFGLDELVSLFLSQLSDNGTFYALVGGGLVASALYTLRAIPNQILNFLRAQTSTTVTVYSEDDTYGWIEEWLSKMRPIPINRNLKLITSKDRRDEFSEKETWSLSPGLGYHLYFYRNRFMLVQRTQEKDQGQSQKRRETVTIRIFTRNKSFVADVIKEAKALKVNETTIGVKIWDEYSWTTALYREKRGFDTLVLNDNIGEKIINDVEKFRSNKKWYHDRGIPYRRGYMFYGPPGTGKTSTVIALASYLSIPVCSLNLNSLHSDEALRSAFTQAPDNSIVLIEDIDAVNASAKRKDGLKKVDKGGHVAIQKTTGEGITLSGLLNVLDGALSTEGRMVVLTTNHLDNLDPALVRPGRIDVAILFDLLGREKAIEFFRKFYDEYDYNLSLPNDFKIAPATLQCLLMQYEDIDEAAKALMSLDVPNSSSNI